MTVSRDKFFSSDRRMKLGFWGLGRGMMFCRTCAKLGIDVVAGCDFNPHLRDHLKRTNPDAFVTDNYEEFLAQEFDGVLLATYCPAHADHAIACLEAGKHVLSEVTTFHTMAEGVRLVEAVEKSGLVYNLAENFPFSAPNMYIAKKWREGLFGDLMYAEYDYIHDLTQFCYMQTDGRPIGHGDTVHTWISWLDWHYYNTHSLGPLMYVTGTRPVRTVSLPGEQRLDGSLMTGPGGMGKVAPSLINMSNGAVVRNLMGSIASDGENRRFWGTRGYAEVVDDRVSLRLGAGGEGEKHEVVVDWDEFGEYAFRTGHAGGDFWALYFFARELIDGDPAPFDIYSASDCTIAGIMAFRSEMNGGNPYDIPDFRKPEAREPYRNDHAAPPRYDVEAGVFPKGADYELTKKFSITMRDLINYSRTYRAYRDWETVLEDMSDPAEAIPMIDRVINMLPRMQEVQKVAREMVNRYPESDGARVLGEMLALGDEEVTSKPAYMKKLKDERRKLSRRIVQIESDREKETERRKQPCKWKSPFVTTWQVSKLYRKQGDISKAKPVKLSQNRGWRSVTAKTSGSEESMLSVNSLYEMQDGVCYLANRFKVRKNGIWTLHLGHDGAVKLFVDGNSVMCVNERINPAYVDRSGVTVKLSRGTHEIVCALDTDAGLGWGIFFRFGVPKDERGKCVDPEFPVQIDF